MLLECEWHVVVATAHIGVLRDEATCQDRVTLVDNALRGGLRLAANLLGSELSEMHLTVVCYTRGHKNKVKICSYGTRNEEYLQAKARVAPLGEKARVLFHTLVLRRNKTVPTSS